MDIKTKLSKIIETTIYQNLTLILFWAALLFLNTLQYMSDSVNSEYYKAISIAYAIYTYNSMYKSIKKLNYMNDSGIVYKFTVIMIFATTFCSIYIHILMNYPDSFCNISKDDYSKNWIGALMITLDMYHYSISNSLFGGSSIIPNTTLLRFINSIQLILTYCIILNGCSNIESKVFKIIDSITEYLNSQTKILN